MIKYAAFLRGINLGKKQVKMEKLRTVLSGQGLKNVKTLLASGNAVFETDEDNPEILKRKMEENLQDAFGFEIPVILRTSTYLHSLELQNPFGKISAPPGTGYYVTFLPVKSVSKLNIPYESPEKVFRVIRLSEGEVYSIVTPSKSGGTVDLMDFLEKQFGKFITTRNWNTVKKIAAI